MTSTVHMTGTHEMSPAELDRLAVHYVETAKRLRSEALGTMFSSFFMGIFNGIRSVFSQPGTLAGSTR